MCNNITIKFPPEEFKFLWRHFLGRPSQVNDVVQDFSQFRVPACVIHCDVRAQDANDDEFSSFTAFLEDLNHKAHG